MQQLLNGVVWQYLKEEIMTVTILENGWISDSFYMGEDPLIYGDAIVMPKEDYDLLTEEQIQAMKKQRYDNWIHTINDLSFEQKSLSLETPQE